MSSELALRARIETLERLIEEIREENILLKKEFGVINEIPLCLRLTRNESSILGMLIKSDQVRKEALHAGIYGTKLDDQVAEQKIIDVWICKMRHKLKPFGISVETVWGFGYAVPSESKQIIRDLLQRERGELAA